MSKVNIKKNNKLDIDQASAKTYIGDMVYQLYEISEMAGLENEANLLYAASLALSPNLRPAKD